MTGTFWAAVDQIAAIVVKVWFCPHVHRHDRRRGGVVECRCLHCGETWEVLAYAYRGHAIDENLAEKECQRSDSDGDLIGRNSHT